MRRGAEPSTIGSKPPAAAGSAGPVPLSFCLAALDGVPAADAVAFVRERYGARALETPGQRRYVARFGAR